MGRRELRYSLGTGYIGVARLKAKQLALAAHALFGRLKNTASSEMPDVYQIRDAADTYFRHLLDKNEFQLMAGLDPHPEIGDTSPDAPRKMAQLLRALLANKKFDILDTYVTTFCQDVDLPEPDDPEERRI